MKKRFSKKKIGFTHTPKFGVTPKGRGFTLVETLIAISIFTVSILAMISILAQSLADTNYTKQKTIASYLAEEGIEYIRNIRDTYVLYDPTSPQNGWNSFNSKLTTASCQASNGCYFDNSNPPNPITGTTMTSCNDSTCSAHPLLYDSATGKYTYTVSGTTVNSGFTRKINITVVSANEIKISSTVSWSQPSGPQNVTFSEDVFNWIQ